MKIVLLIFGIISFLVALIAIIVPILPTTPLLLLALYLFTQSSKRIENWFLKTKIYDKYLADFHQNNSMTIRHKITVLLFSDSMMIISFILTDSLIVKLVLIVLEIIKYYFFIIKIQTTVNI